VSKLGINFLMNNGFTIGISDQDITKEAKTNIQEIVKKVERECINLIEKYENKELEQLPGQTIKESLETYIMKTLRKVVDEASNIISETLPENCAVVMAKSGARGSMLNLTQLAGCIGQQTLQGERIHRGYKNRTLPHFKKGELSPQSRGFIPASFKDGLTPFEFFFNAMNGREGLMDKSLRTRKSGYMERRLVNALQELKVEYDGTVRDDWGRIVQFHAAEDCLDPSKSEWGTIKIKDIIESEMGD
ncbi:MAG: DNA-directed RNA polymerase subunit A', partial [Candidatus Aenigmarchaeota archaeon]|nr:DNA-directed RNA polymerase subunit A' [Candidatus Aenigmarchaeota archaeon]